MNNEFDVVLIGAGIVGASLALELGKLGLKVGVFDKGKACGGASKMTGGICRVFDLDENIAELALESADWYNQMTVAHGSLLGEPHVLPFRYFLQFKHSVSAQSIVNRLSVKTDYPIVLSDPEAISPCSHERFCTERSLVVSEINSFFLDVPRMVNGLLNLAKVYDVTVLECNPVTSIRQDSRGYQVKSIYGEFISACVICSAGGNSVSILRSCVPNISQRARGIEAFVFERPRGLQFSFVDGSTGLYGRPLDRDLSLIGFPTEDWMDLGLPKGQLAQPSSKMQHAMNDFFGARDWRPLGRRYAFDTFSYNGPMDPIQEPMPGLYTYLGQGGGVKIAPALSRRLTAKVAAFFGRAG